MAGAATTPRISERGRPELLALIGDSDADAAHAPAEVTLDLSAEQTTKTHKALGYFGARAQRAS